MSGLDTGGLPNLPGRVIALDLALVRAFIHVHDTGSISAATTATATDLGYSQSGLSQRIQTLEHMVGCRLFIRGPQGVKPTQDATTTLPYARMLLTIAEALHHELGRNRRPNNRR
jgi:DNA-binding transcriptional LysR family regulator